MENKIKKEKGSIDRWIDWLDKIDERERERDNADI